MLSEEKIKELAYQNADVDVDRRGRETFSFDTHGLARIARAIEAAVREELAKQEPVTWGVDWGIDGDKSCCSIVKHHSFGKKEIVAVEYSPTPVVPDGMVMVPREPSDQMIYAAKWNGAEGSDEEIASDYRAMIAAAEKQDARS